MAGFKQKNGVMPVIELIIYVILATTLIPLAVGYVGNISAVAGNPLASLFGQAIFGIIAYGALFYGVYKRFMSAV